MINTLFISVLSFSSFQIISLSIYKRGIWSSADDTYVEELIKHIKPEAVNFEIVWGRSRCSHRRNIELDDYFYEKRLDKLKKKALDLNIFSL
jgi:carboxy-terminal domain RNA polymerase II polypeptide A small phosphatase